MIRVTREKGWVKVTVSTNKLEGVMQLLCPGLQLMF
jgi:hypothetical protein